MHVEEIGAPLKRTAPGSGGTSVSKVAKGVSCPPERSHDLGRLVLLLVRDAVHNSDEFVLVDDPARQSNHRPIEVRERGGRSHPAKT
jgi:hypothetical protein